MTTRAASLSVAISRRHKKNLRAPKKGPKVEACRWGGYKRVSPWRQAVSSPNIRGDLTEQGAGRFSGFRIGLLAAPSPREMREWHRCGVRPRLQRRDRGGFRTTFPLCLPTRETGTEWYSVVNRQGAYRNVRCPVKTASRRPRVKKARHMDGHGVFGPSSRSAASTVGTIAAGGCPRAVWWNAETVIIRPHRRRARSSTALAFRCGSGFGHVPVGLFQEGHRCHGVG